MRERRHYKPALLGLAVLLLVVSGVSQNHLNRDRDQLGLTNAKPLENAPPVLAFTTVALGGFRGLIANVLWVRAHQLQLDGKYFELIQLSDWITKLQPRIPMVWRFHAWNLAYNIPVKFPDMGDRWPWVKRGVEMLRDEALRYNPHEITLYQEIGIIYQHKMGGNTDDAHMFYKYELAKIMEELLGGTKPNYDELLNPQTEAARQRVRRMREEFKLDPAIMKEVDEKYGPLEWRLPETHAIYWSVVGMKKSSQEDKLILRRTIYQSMQLAVQRGKLILYPIAEGRFRPEFAPNIEMIPNANRVYEEMIEEQVRSVPEREREAVREHMGTGHRNFLARAVHDLYLHNRITAAKQWYEYLGKKFPFEIEGSRSVDEYVVGRYIEEVGYEKPAQLVGGRDRLLAMIHGLLTQYFHYLAVGEDEMAMGRRNHAIRIHAAHMEKITDPKMESIYERLKLPPIPEIERTILLRLFDPKQPELSPLLQAQLLTRLGLSAPPTVAAPGGVTGAEPVRESELRKEEGQRKKQKK